MVDSLNNTVANTVLYILLGTVVAYITYKYSNWHVDRKVTTFLDTVERLPHKGETDTAIGTLLNILVDTWME